ncbi:MAG: murein hydrolase activator EnvC family protein [Actinomycetota bacterium]
MRANRGRSHGRARRLRRLVGAVVAAVLLMGVVPAGADTKSQLSAAKQRLVDLQHQITSQEAQLADIQQQEAAQRSRLDALQGEMNDLAVKLDHAQNAYDATVAQVAETEASLQVAKNRYRALRGRLDARARAAYEMGPASSLGIILGSATVGELSDKLEFVNQLSSLDANLAAEVQNRANALEAQRLQLEEIRARQVAALNDLHSQQMQLDAKFNEAKGIYDDLASKAAQVASIANDLQSKQSEVDSLVGRLQRQLKAEQLAAARAAAAEAARQAAAAKAAQQQQQQQDSGGSGGGGSGGGGSGGGGSGGGSGGTVSGSPFSVCPVDQPRAYGDSFGAPRYAGGYHPHAGNDILAPRGTAIRAPFSGTASADANGLGGNAVIVSGTEGFVYNAHLNSYGTLGSVSAGTVIGYVGDSGDAQGGPTHDHFEWHPNVIPSNPYRSVYGYTVIGDAIDPYPYLNMVC